MISDSDSYMPRMMGLVSGALVVLALLAGLTASILKEDVFDASVSAQLQRIQPVADVRTSADDLPGAQPVAASDASAEPVAAAEIVASTCSACHEAGVAGAPVIGDEAEWAKRREAGLDALLSSVIDGKGAMPARAGSSFSDDELRSAVQHLAMFEVVEEAAAGASAAETSAEGADAAADGASDAAGEGAAEGATDGAAPATDGDASVEHEAESVADTGEPAASEVDVASAATSSAAVAGTTVAEFASADVPDEVKSVVDTACAACHIAGVAGAPKFGDTAAWNERLAKGVDAVLQTAVAGKGAMPARGGSSLDDEELASAIQYMLTK
ncbi:MAG: cytochrome c5 family protein [Gammaproteobacteria bacterium]|nr:MAG: cytochrome c5 family protein [Gammaproteobacteria bacterium]